MAPIVHGLETEYFDQVKFSYLDIDDAKNADVKQELGFRVQPEFYLVDSQGNVLQKWVGPVTEQQFQDAFSEHAGK